MLASNTQKSKCRLKFEPLPTHKMAATARPGTALPHLPAVAGPVGVGRRCPSPPFALVLVTFSTDDLSDDLGELKICVNVAMKIHGHTPGVER